MLYLEARLSGRPTRWSLKRASVEIGRDPACDIVVDDPSVSRRHALLNVSDPAALQVTDVGSRNGTWVSGERVGNATVNVDEWFSVGSVLLSIRRGVSLRSGSGSSVSAHGTAAGGADTTHGGTTTEADAGQWDRALIAALTAALSLDDAGQALGELLHAVVEKGQASGAIIVRHIGSGSAVIEAAGELPVSYTPDDLFDRSDPNDDFRLLRRELSDPATWLVVYPRPERVSRGVLDLTVATLSRLIRFEDAEAARTAAVRGPSPDRPSGPGHSPAFLTHSPACHQCLAEIDRLAVTALPVLIVGESGTGKELLAARLHEQSPRRDKPFIAVNCAAIPHDLLEAEIFGIESGVATGVTARPGRLRLAHGGTLFLDEIADLPLTLQPKLLRALESGEIFPLGAPAGIHIDVRLVSATHRDLTARVQQGTFREDLYHRLAGSTVGVPPLRERPEDLLPLIRHFAKHAAREQGRQFHGLDLDATRMLLGYAWPGNVRELKNAVARAVALADGPILHAELVPQNVRRDTDHAKGEARLGGVDDYRTARARFERHYFEQLLDLCGGNVAEASRRAGMNRVYLHRKLKELGIR